MRGDNFGFGLVIVEDPDRVLLDILRQIRKGIEQL
jgi:hypothetical protein